MNEELERQLQECIKSFADYQQLFTNDPEGWVRWFACVSHFQNSEYTKAAESAASLLADQCLPKWFPVLQILLISLRHIEDIPDLDNWGSRLLGAAPLTPWMSSLAKLVLDKADIKTVLSEAKDDERICQAHYYMGENLLSVGNTKKAQESFEQSIAIDVQCVEYRLAKGRIESLEKLADTNTQDDGFTLTTKHRYVPVAPTKDELEKWLRRGSGEQLLSAVSKLFGGESPQDIALLADQHRTDSWFRIIRRLASSKIVKGPVPQGADSQWLPREVRYALADAYKEVFLEKIESVSLVQGHSSLGNFQLFKGSDLLRFSQLPPYQNVKHQLESNNDIGTDSKRYFVSHRWLSTGQPDPTGIQMKLLKENIFPEAYYWIDYSCLPQKSRTLGEDKLFRESLKWLPSLLFDMDFIVLRCRDDGYFGRAWCFFELLAANVLGRTISYIVEDKTFESSYINDERQVLEQTLLNMDLPDTLDTTDPDDLETIRIIVQNVALFFKLRVVEHYMALGQDISDQALFFAEDPYYFLATCDFSDVMLWLFDKTRELRMQLIDLSRDYYNQNFLSKIAQKEHFPNVAEPYNMSKKVALDESRLEWLAANRYRDDSASNLFYKITSMIK